MKLATSEYQKTSQRGIIVITTITIRKTLRCKTIIHQDDFSMAVPAFYLFSHELFLKKSLVRNWTRDRILLGFNSIADTLCDDFCDTFLE